VQQNRQRSTRKQKNNYIYTKKCETSEKEIRNYEITKIPILNELNEPIMVLVIFNDITERTKMIDELLNAKLIANNANRAKSNFIATISHEIRNQLNSILGIVEIIKEEEISQDLERYISLINKAELNINNLINDVLDLSKLEANKIELKYESTDLLLLLKEIIDSDYPLAQNKNFEILLDFHLKYQHKCKQIHSNLNN